MLAKEIAKPGYQTATPPERKERLEAIQNAADKIGRERLYNENLEFRERMTEWQAQKNSLMHNR